MEVLFFRFFAWFLGRLLHLGPTLASADQRRAISERLIIFEGNLKNEGGAFLLRHLVAAGLRMARYLRLARWSRFGRSFLAAAAMLLLCYLTIGFCGIFGGMPNAQRTLPWRIFDESANLARNQVLALAKSHSLHVPSTPEIDGVARHSMAYADHYTPVVRDFFSAGYVFFICLSLAGIWWVCVRLFEAILKEIEHTIRPLSLLFFTVGTMVILFFVRSYALGVFSLAELPAIWPTLYVAIPAAISHRWVGGAWFAGGLSAWSLAAWLMQPGWVIFLVGLASFPLRLAMWILLLTSFLFLVQRPLTFILLRALPLLRRGINRAEQ